MKQIDDCKNCDHSDKYRVMEVGSHLWRSFNVPARAGAPRVNPTGTYTDRFGSLLQGASTLKANNIFPYL